MKTVICLSFIVLNNFLHSCVKAASRQAKEGAPPKQKSFPKMPSMPTQTFLALAAVSRWWLFFFLKPTETSEKSRPNWRDDLSFFVFEYQLKTW